jgi:hypothetical protein
VAPPLLRITANAPIQQLRIGARTIVLPDPAAELEVPLADRERAGTFQLGAVASGGRRTAATIQPWQQSATLHFAPAPSRRARRPAAGSAPAQPDDRLVDSPYGAP